jgi:NAD(P)-dependent dehydrogenase (short-subunit alcohol dehydrogenase family)
MERLRGRVAIVTGSGGSIGRAACLRFADEGALVIGCDHDEAGAKETLREVRVAGGTMLSVHPCDLTDPAAMDAVTEQALDRFGRIDILYNNAAMAHFEPFDTLNADAFRRVLRDELEISFHGCKSVWPVMQRQGGGVILNTASVSGLIGYRVVPGLAHSTAKAGILGMTRHLAMEGAPHRIRVNAVSPGLIRTNQSAALIDDPEWGGAMLDKIMLDRVGAPEDVAAAAAFLVSDDAAWITGTNLVVDGGTTAW